MKALVYILFLFSFGFILFYIFWMIFFILHIFFYMFIHLPDVMVLKSGIRSKPSSPPTLP